MVEPLLDKHTELEESRRTSARRTVSKYSFNFRAIRHSAVFVALAMPDNNGR